jgi:hypothetical protein
MREFIKTLILGLILIPAASAQEMPDSVKKDKLIEALILNDVIKAEHKDEVQANSKVKFSFAESSIGYGLMAIAPIGMNNVMGHWDEGDQDFEEFHMTYRIGDHKFNLNCHIRTDEVLSEDNMKIDYKLKLKNCSLKNKTLGSTKEVIGPFASKTVKWQRDSRYERGIDETDAHEIHISGVERFQNHSGRAPSRSLAVEGDIEYADSSAEEVAGTNH